MIAENLKQVKLRIDSVKHEQQVQLIAVSKARSVTEIQQAVDAGQIQFGANYFNDLLKNLNIKMILLDLWVLVTGFTKTMIQELK